MEPFSIGLLAIVTGGVMACIILSAIKVTLDWLTTDDGDDGDDDPSPPPAPVLTGTYTVTRNTFAGGGESTTDKWEFYGPAPTPLPDQPTPYSPEELRSFGGFNAPKYDPTPEIRADKDYAWTTRTETGTTTTHYDTTDADDGDCISVRDIADLVQALYDYNAGQRPLPSDNEIRQFAYLAWLWCARHPNTIYPDFTPHYRGRGAEPTVHFTKEP